MGVTGNRAGAADAQTDNPEGNFGLLARPNGRNGLLRSYRRRVLTRRTARRAANGTPLQELHDRAEEIRDAVRARVMTAGNLRYAAESANESAEDVAQTVFLRLWALVKGGHPEAIRDMKAYAKKMADNHVATLARRPILRQTDATEPETLERLAGPLTQSQGPEEIVERRLSEAQVETIVAALSDRQRLLIKMRVELGMTVPEMAEVLGASQKSCEKHLDRAIAKVKRELAEGEDLDSADRRRLSRVMAAKRWGSPSLLAGLERDMNGDMRLASLWRQSNGALHDVAAAVAVDESLSRLDAGPGLTDRVLSVAEKARDSASGILSRGGPEGEAATGAALGGTGLATKAIVAACIAGPAAGGVCVATGVVDFPKDQDPTAPARPVADSTTTTNSPALQPVQTEEASPELDSEPAVEPNPTQQVNDELGFGTGGANNSAASSSRDFAAPTGAGSSGGGGSGGGGGGGSGGGEAFGFE